MVDAETARGKWAVSSGAWIATIRRGEANRVLLLDAPMLDLAGNVNGQRVLDVGCGEGRFCRMLAERGATVVGVDPTREFLREAARMDTTGPQPSFVRAVGEDLPLADGSFDLAVSYLTLIDIPDFRGAIREIARVLRPGGRVIVANLNPFVTTRPAAWYRDAEGRKLHVAVEDYYEEKAMVLEWADLSIVNWHRPMEDYMQAFLRSGFALEAFSEPRPTLEAVAEHPPMLDEYRVPLFHVMQWRKD